MKRVGRSVSQRKCSKQLKCDSMETLWMQRQAEYPRKYLGIKQKRREEALKMKKPNYKIC